MMDFFRRARRQPDGREHCSLSTTIFQFSPVPATVPGLILSADSSRRPAHLGVIFLTAGMITSPRRSRLTSLARRGSLAYRRPRFLFRLRQLLLEKSLRNQGISGWMPARELVMI